MDGLSILCLGNGFLPNLAVFYVAFLAKASSNDTNAHPSGYLSTIPGKGGILIGVCARHRKSGWLNRKQLLTYISSQWVKTASASAKPRSLKKKVSDCTTPFIHSANKSRAMLCSFTVSSFFKWSPAFK